MRSKKQVKHEVKNVINSLNFHANVDTADIESPADAYLDNLEFAGSLSSDTCDSDLNWNDRNDY